MCKMFHTFKEGVTQKIFLALYTVPYNISSINLTHIQWPWNLKQHVLPKSLYTSIIEHSVVSQMISTSIL
jgi:hypothetical protein